MYQTITLYDPCANVWREVPIAFPVVVVQLQPGVLQELWEMFLAFVRAFLEECGRLFAQRLIAPSYTH